MTDQDLEDWEAEDPLAPARGIMVALVLDAPLWAGLWWVLA